MTHTTRLSLLFLLSAVPVLAQEESSQAASLSALEERLQALLQQIHEAQEANGSGETEESAEAAPPATAVGILESRIEELDQKVRILERQLEIEKEQAKERAAQTPAVG